MKMTAFAPTGSSGAVTFTVAVSVILGFIFVVKFATAVSFFIRKLCRNHARRHTEDEPPEIHHVVSSKRRAEIETLRKNALLRYLSKFTLTLGDANLYRCSGSSSTSTQTDATASSSSSDINNVCECAVSDINCKGFTENEDIETGCEATLKYTHIVVPKSGYDITGMCYDSNMNNLVEDDDDKNVHRDKKWMLSSMLRSGVDNDHVNENEIEEASTIVSITNARQLKKGEKRKVPIFCAICLMEYKKNDRVCWSSNVDCSHVFHEDCIMQWLMTSGKKRSMYQYFDKNTSDEELLKNEHCPCCRQDFICVSPGISSGSK